MMCVFAITSYCRTRIQYYKGISRNNKSMRRKKSNHPVNHMRRESFNYLSIQAPTFDNGK